MGSVGGLSTSAILAGVAVVVFANVVLWSWRSNRKRDRHGPSWTNVFTKQMANHYRQHEEEIAMSIRNKDDIAGDPFRLQNVDEGGVVSIIAYQKLYEEKERQRELSCYHQERHRELMVNPPIVTRVEPTIAEAPEDDGPDFDAIMVELYREDVERLEKRVKELEEENESLWKLRHVSAIATAALEVELDRGDMDQDFLRACLDRYTDQLRRELGLL